MGVPPLLVYPIGASEKMAAWLIDFIQFPVSLALIFILNFSLIRWYGRKSAQPWRWIQHNWLVWTVVQFIPFLFAALVQLFILPFYTRPLLFYPIGLGALLLGFLIAWFILNQTKSR